MRRDMRVYKHCVIQSALVLIVASACGDDGAVSTGGETTGGTESGTTQSTSAGTTTSSPTASSGAEATGSDSSSTSASSLGTTGTESTGTETTDGAPVCGDSSIEGDEECDDGNDVDGDGCNAGCVRGGKLVWETSFDAGAAAADLALGVAIDSRGDIVIAGGVGPDSSDLSMWVSKHDSAGETLWDWSWPGPVMGSTRLNGVAINHADEIIVTGQMENLSGAVEIWTGKFSSEGTLMWAEIAAGNPSIDAIGLDVAIANAADDILVVGSLAPGTETDTDMFVRGYDTDGTPNLGYPHDESNEADLAVAVAVGSDGRYAMAGQTMPGGAIVVSFDPTGAELWSRTFAPGLGVATGVRFHSDGGFYLGGIFGDGVDLTAFVRKYAPDGSVEWERLDADEDRPTQYGLATDSLNNVITAAKVNQAAIAPSYPRVRKRSADGEELWLFEGEERRTPRAVTVGDGGRVVIAGNRSFGVGEDADFWIAELTP